MAKEMRTVIPTVILQNQIIPTNTVYAELFNLEVLFGTEHMSVQHICAHIFGGRQVITFIRFIKGSMIFLKDQQYKIILFEMEQESDGRHEEEGSGRMCILIPCDHLCPQGLAWTGARTPSKTNADRCEPVKPVYLDLCSDCRCPERPSGEPTEEVAFQEIKTHCGKERSEKGQEQEWNLKFTIFHINSQAVSMVFMKLFQILKNGKHV